VEGAAPRKGGGGEAEGGVDFSLSRGESRGGGMKCALLVFSLTVILREQFCEIGTGTGIQNCSISTSFQCIYIYMYIYIYLSKVSIEKFLFTALKSSVW
jgi:hypothetical protein